MNHYHILMDDDDWVTEGKLSQEELNKASDNFRRLRSENPEVWEDYTEKLSI